MLLRRAARALVCAGVFLLPLVSYAQACSWAAAKDSLFQLHVGVSVATSDAKAIAMGGSGCGVWVLGASSLKRYGADGAVALEVPLQLGGKRLDLARHLAVDAYDGSVWLAGDKLLAHVSSAGVLLQSPAYDGVPRAIAVGLDQSVAVLGDKQVLRFSSVGEALGATALNTEANRHLAVDSLRATTWAATNRDLVRMKEGEATWSFRTGTTIAGIALEPLSGRVWLAEARTLRLFEPNGTLVRSIDMAVLIESIAFDTVAGKLWVWTKDGVARLSASGEVEARIDARFGTGLFAMPAFAVQPVITLIEPPADAITNNDRRIIAVGYAVQCNAQPCDPGAAYLSRFVLNATLDNASIGQAFVFDPATAKATFTPTSSLPQGTNTFTAQARDSLGRLSNAIRATVFVDSVAPVVTIASPVQGLLTNVAAQTVSGTVNEPATVLVNNTPASASNGAFTANVTLAEGTNTIVVSAVDAAGNAGQAQVSVRLDTQVPGAPVVSALTISSPSGGLVTVVGGNGAVEAGATVKVTNARTGATATAVAGANGTFNLQLGAQGGDSINIAVIDAAGNQGPAASLAVPGGLPPDPSTVATPIDPTVPTRVGTSTAFLYSGANPVQTGVAAGTIDPKRAAVLRGRVLAREGQALPGVKVTIKDKPEFGQTFSREDGWFDIVVNGGGQITLNYEGTGLLPIQRTVNTPWSDWVRVPDAALIALDSRVTRIDMGSPALQVAQSSPATDSSGTRQVTMLFPPGTTAQLLMPDGTMTPATSLNVRATEYTVGPGGPNAMPGDLPPTTSYTYAVELGADEAIAAGAKSIIFNQYVPVYVDNFLGMPVGTAVPVGYYDRSKAAWIGSENGRVIRILSVTNGLADLDLTGQGVAATPAQLAMLRITDDERAQLAVLFEVGKTLWRVPHSHFTPCDYNWLAAKGPISTGCDANGKCISQDPKPDPESCEAGGCIIETQNQVLGERLSITGTPFELRYRSSRVPGYKGGSSIRIPLTNQYPPKNATNIRLEVGVAGKWVSQDFAPGPDLTHRFFWDGKDAYGRDLHGRHLATVRIGYTIKSPMLITPAIVQDLVEVAQAWGVPGQLEGPLGKQEVIGWVTFFVQLDAPVPGTSQHMGGWGIDANHVYDVQRGLLMHGDGTVREAPVLAIDTYTQPGVGSWNVVPDLATQADGSVLVSGGIGNISNGGLRRITPTGEVTSLTGTATARSVTHRPGGEIYITGAVGIGGRDGIFQVNADGTLKAIAGVPTQAQPTDPASAAMRQLIYPRRIAADREGNVYFTQQVRRQGSSLVNDCKVRRVNLSGTISDIAGNGSCFNPGGDDGPALAAGMQQPEDLAVDDAGNVYFTDGVVVRKVTADGKISTVAGMRTSGDATDGRPATEAWLGVANPMGQQPLVLPVQALTIDRAGDLLITTWNRVMRLGKDGILRTLIGSTATICAQTLEARAAALGACTRGLGATVEDPLGRIFVIENGNPGEFTLRKVDPALPQEVQGEVVVPSSDGAVVHVFSAEGRHKRSLDAKLKSTLLEFGYDTTGRLLTMRDGDANETRIERTASGTATGIVSPYGQRSTIVFNSNGYLQRLTNPAGEGHTMEYTADGLLTKFTTPRGFSNTFSYDVTGLLRQDRDAAGGGWDIVRDEESGEVTMTSVAGRATKYRNIGGVERVVRAPDGVETHSFSFDSGTSYIIKPNGTRVLREQGPDPRFGMQVPVEKRTLVTLPSGLEFTQTATRSATTSGDLLNLGTQTDAVTINGKTWTATFDAAARTQTSMSPLGRKSVVKVDDKARPVQSSMSGVEPIAYGYDSQGRLMNISQGSGAQVRSTSMGYDSLGRLQTVTDALGRSTSYAYDSSGRVTRKTMPDGRAISFAYDLNGNLTSITPPGRPAHGFAFTPVDMQESYDPPAVPGVATPATTYSYDLDRSLMAITRPDGQVIGFGRDVVGRVSSVSTPSGTTTYAYSTTNGELTGMTAPGGIVLDYDYDGDLLVSETWSGPVAGRVGRTYDPNLDLQALDIAGMRYSFSYDSDRMLTGVGPMTIGRDAANGTVRSTQLGGVATNQTYTNFGELQNHTASYGVTTLYSQSFTYDKAGRITGKTEQTISQTDGFAYGYDAGGRLESVSKNGAPVTAYQYDSNGNRTSDGVNVATYDSQDRLVQYGPATFTYTDNGELKTKRVGAEVTHYEYDVLGNLRKVTMPNGTVIEYLIDGRNRRIGRKVNGVLEFGLLYLEQLSPVAQLDADGNVVARFVYGTKQNAPDFMQKGGKTYQFLTDHLGSVRLVVDVASGEVAQRMDYDVFGVVSQDSNPGFQPFGFAGGLHDSSTGLTRFGARDYDPFVGRWTAKDPIRFDGLDSNVYRYANGDPVNVIDPLGLLGWADLPLLPDGVVDFSAGFGDTLSIGATGWARSTAGIHGGVNQCSGGYEAGKWAAIALEIGLGGALGWEAAGTKGAGKEFSHWIPNRMGGPRSKWNGNFVSRARHYYHDPYRYPAGWRDLGPKWPAWLQQLDRIPNVYKGGAAGATAGAAGAGKSCLCQ